MSPPSPPVRQVLGKTVRVEHVEDYKRRKAELEGEDAIAVLKARIQAGPCRKFEARLYEGRQDVWGLVWRMRGKGCSCTCLFPLYPPSSLPRFPAYLLPLCPASPSSLYFFFHPEGRLLEGFKMPIPPRRGG